MKNKKLFIGIVLLIAILVLGVAYAAITGTLKITGSASAIVSDSNFVVRFTDDEITTDIQTVNTSTADDTKPSITATKTNDLNATINVNNLTAKGDYATATYTIENASEDLSASLTATATNTNTEYFKVTTTGITDEAITIEKGNPVTITVKVELIKTPTESTVSDTVTVTINAESVQP